MAFVRSPFSPRPATDGAATLSRPGFALKKGERLLIDWRAHRQFICLGKRGFGWQREARRVSSFLSRLASHHRVALGQSTQQKGALSARPTGGRQFRKARLPGAPGGFQLAARVGGAVDGTRLCKGC
jgi:hypothetical protein